MLPESIIWKNGELLLLDQRELPFEVRYAACRSAEDVAVAIKNMTVRGAPAIGAAAAYGLAMAAVSEDFERSAQTLLESRPTAVNLSWAVDRMRRLYHENTGLPGKELFRLLEAEAVKIHKEDIEINRKIGFFGQQLLPGAGTVITHCNAGALATAGYGTALGVFRAASEAGKKIKIYADETRPRLQGARLTAFELFADGFDVTVITDSMAAFLMSRRKIDAVVTGADRIAANGDTANKIGTYSLAVSAHFHSVPFYIAAPLSTFDIKCASGADIPIEHRDGSEVREICGARVLPDEIDVWNPSFDVTPAELITGIITERGVIRAPFAGRIKELLTEGAVANEK
ncbi:MAG: S-methyl-5-thioribose-1-phosphate isomerase [Synergistes sp.]|nr:S-methyl-5-thioribose-1-phosphate isomerase [Synergistes sp.]